MTYAFVTEWMSAEDREKFDRDLDKSPAQQAMSGARDLMAIFGMAQGMGG